MESKHQKTSVKSTPVLSVLTLGLSLACAAHAEQHVANPFVGATSYLNPDFSKEVNSSISRVTDASLKAKMATVKSYPTAIWLDSIGSVSGGPSNSGRLGLRGHLDNALAQRTGSSPITVSLIIYDLPGRDCHALASNGELPLTAEGLQRYKKEYVDAIATMLAEPKYKDIRIVNIIEPDSLPNLVTNMSDYRCAQASSTGIYEEGVRYALNKLHALPNVYNYLDIGHSGWLGWDSNRGPAVSLYTRVVQGTTAGLASVDGFITNTANTTPLTEPNLPDSNLNIGGRAIKSSKYYEWNPYFSEISFAQGLYSEFVKAGWPSTISLLIDTGRNGWGGAQRPTAANGSDVDSYVNSGRVDRRLHRGNWCNQSGAGIGMPPTVAPAEHIAAYVWAKPPGESDGSSSKIPNSQGKGFDRMCDPTYTTPDGVLSGAMPNAPLSGEWFHDMFVDLVKNAYPVIGATAATQPTTPTQPVPTQPTTPTQPVPTRPTTPTQPMPTQPMPTQPTTPTQPVPTRPTTPTQPVPTQPTTPTQPVPTRPTTPTQPVPTRPTTPTQPVPTRPTTPTQPVPTRPITPTQPVPTVTQGRSTFGILKTIDSDWGTGYCSRIKVTNTGAVSGNWSIQTQISGRPYTVWNAQWSHQGQTLTASGMGWNQNLRPGGTTEFGYCANR